MDSSLDMPRRRSNANQSPSLSPSPSTEDEDDREPTWEVGELSFLAVSVGRIRSLAYQFQLM